MTDLPDSIQLKSSHETATRGNWAAVLISMFKGIVRLKAEDLVRLILRHNLRMCHIFDKDFIADMFEVSETTVRRGG